ncbi:unnamed protein product [Darwinula stevensoni]|uniref:Uncharacterized protein n=1 Tax=Darwinula stevensoni TaxID=69355 RepID=A0A7R8XIY5_9CRUS|nr:unnamed protein product [Darwinula stevensoni]CAG0893881.1 unnamed protein product [Darwinula stevensoni]
MADLNNVSEIQLGFFEGLTALEKFYCYPCYLGLTLRNGTLAFNSPYLRDVDVLAGGILSLESHATTGLMPDTRISLGGSLISELAEGTFRPMLEILSQGEGSISVSSEIFDC